MTIWDRFFTPAQQLAWRSTKTLPPNQGEMGEEARKLLDNPVLVEALDRVERKLTETWKNTPPGDEAAREAAYALYWAAQQFRVELKLMIANASMSGRQ